MQDELLAACQTLLRQGLPSVVPGEFDDEHRLIPLGVDINGDVAAFAWWLPEGAQAGRAGLRTSTFPRADGDRAYVGGGVGEFRAYPLAERPPAGLQRSYLRPCGYGQTRRGEPRRFLSRAGYVSHAVFRAAAEVYWLQIGYPGVRRAVPPSCRTGMGRSPWADRHRPRRGRIPAGQHGAAPRSVRGPIPAASASLSGRVQDLPGRGPAQKLAAYQHKNRLPY